MIDWSRNNIWATWTLNANTNTPHINILNVGISEHLSHHVDQHFYLHKISWRHFHSLTHSNQSYTRNINYAFSGIDDNKHSHYSLLDDLPCKLHRMEFYSTIMEFYRAKHFYLQKVVYIFNYSKRLCKWSTV